MENQSTTTVTSVEPQKVDPRSFGPSTANWLLFVRLAFQNLLRQPTRTMLLILAVAMGTGAVFASFTVACGIERSMSRSFARMGADLIVVPESTLVNITSALLTVQPSDAMLDKSIIEQISRLPGIAHVTPQTLFRIPIMAGMPDCKANLIAIDPKSDFTIMPWMSDHLSRPMKTGDIISGGCRSENVNEEIQVCDVPSPIFGKLSRSGVGPVDDSFFATYDTIAAIAAAPNVDRRTVSCLTKPGVSAALVRLDFGATPEQVRFALARIPGVKVVTGTKVMTVTRQTTTALLSGMVVFTVIMLAGSLLLVGLLFSAIITERKREIGLLRAIGCRRKNIIRMLVSEAAFATGIGGLFGIILGGALLLVFQHSLIYYLETMHIEFAWPAVSDIGLTALVCAVLAALVGLLGALIPAVRTTGEEPYVLIQDGGR